jgi:hypothetical protein
MSDPFWYNDFQILFNKDRLIEFFPTKDQTDVEKLNSLVRLSIYIAIILFFYNSDTTYFVYAVVVALFTIFLYKNNTEKLENVDEEDMVENVDEEGMIEEVNCTRPTLDNPFMNFTIKDFMNIENGKTVDKPPACDANTPDIKKEIDDNFNNNLYRDVDDVFGKMNSQRQFFTMPWTTILPDENGDFKNWLYKSPKTCKEDSDYCNRYEDIRQKAPIFVNPDINPAKINN